jgi:hypothetical protein
MAGKQLHYNRKDPLDDTNATAMFQSKETAGEAVLEIANVVLVDSGSDIVLIEIMKLQTQQVVIPSTDARYVKLDIKAIGIKNGVRVYVNIEIQLKDTMDMTNRSILHLSFLLLDYANDMKGKTTVDVYKGFPYLIAINLLDYVIPGQSHDVHRLVQLSYNDTGKPATDRIEIHHIQLPQLTAENFDPKRKLHLLIGALKKLRGEFNIAGDNENTKETLTAISEYENSSQGFKQLAERFKIVRGLSEEEVNKMAQVNLATATELESYITMDELREQGRQEAQENDRRTVLNLLDRAGSLEEVRRLLRERSLSELAAN